MQNAIGNTQLISILESDPGLSSDKKNIVDNRLKLVKQKISTIKNKDDELYSNLINLISYYIDKLYDKKFDDFPVGVLGKDGNFFPQEYDSLDFADMHKLDDANRNFSISLFNYVCEILKLNVNIKLNYETLKKLLNRNPKALTFSVEQDYIYRSLNFIKLVKILNTNNTLEKSNIKIDDIYQLLIDTCQINNEPVVKTLVDSEKFKENHKKIDKFLSWCNAKVFAEVFNIIKVNFDTDYDVISILKRRKTENFSERFIIHMLSINKDSNIIHQILTNGELSIDYNYGWADYFGQTTLRDRLAYSDNRILINDLLSKEENIRNCYWDGEFKIQLYRLYAILGNYEKALAHFKEYYYYASDFTEDYSEGFNKDGYAKGDLTYIDSLSAFVESICTSVLEDELDYSTKKDIIFNILNNENIKIINIDAVLPAVQKVLNCDDFKALVETLLSSYKNGSLEFIEVSENQEAIYESYFIRFATAEEIQNSLLSLDIKYTAEELNLTRTKKDDSNK